MRVATATNHLSRALASPLGFSARLGVVTREFGHKHAKDGSSRLRLAFDDAAVIANDLGGERKAKAAAAWLGGHEGIEEIGHQVIGYARAVVPDAEFERQPDPRFAARKRQPNARPQCGGELDFSVRRAIPDGFGGVLDKVEEHLDELVAIGEHGWQRGIVLLDKPAVAGKA